MDELIINISTLLLRSEAVTVAQTVRQEYFRNVKIRRCRSMQTMNYCIYKLPGFPCTSSYNINALYYQLQAGCELILKVPYCGKWDFYSF